MLAVVGDSNGPSFLFNQVEGTLFAVIALVERNLQTRNGSQIRNVRGPRFVSVSMGMSSFTTAWRSFFNQRLRLRDERCPPRDIRFGSRMIYLTFLRICARAPFAARFGN